MKRWTFAASIFISLAANMPAPADSPSSRPALPTTQPNQELLDTTKTSRFDPLLGLDEFVRRMDEKGVSPKEAAILAKLEIKFRKNKDNARLANDLVASKEEIAAMSTVELARRLLVTGALPGQLMLNDDPNVAILGLGVVDNGYQELFARPDFWKTLAVMFDFYSAHLHSDNLQDGISETIGLSSMSKVFALSPFREAIAGHEKELIQADIIALRRASDYLNSPAEQGSLTQAPLELVNIGLALGHRISPDQFEASRKVLEQFAWSRNHPTTDEMILYFNKSAQELEKFVQ
jgi:hypothetical protein